MTVQKEVFNFKNSNINEMECNVVEENDQNSLASNYILKLNETISKKNSCCQPFNYINPVDCKFQQSLYKLESLAHRNKKTAEENKKASNHINKFQLFQLQQKKYAKNNYFQVIEGDNHLNNSTKATKNQKLNKDFCNLEEILLSDVELNYSSKFVSFCHNYISYIPIYITKFTILQELNLDFNQIRMIPPFISKLSFLQAFTISHNLINEIPDFLAILKNLAKLGINDNLIKIFPRFICNLPLKTFMIQNNPIFSIPSSFYQLFYLESFGFDWFNYSLSNKESETNPVGNIKKIRKLKNACRTQETKEKNCSLFDYLLHFYDTTIENLALIKIFPKKRNLLHFSTIQGNKYLVDYILKSNFNINEIDENNSTPFILGLEANQYECSLMILSNNKCDPNINSSKYGVPLHIMIQSKNFFIAEAIINHIKFNPNVEDNEGNNALHLIFSINNSENLNTLESLSGILLEKGINPNKINQNLLSPLNIAIKKNNKFAVNLAIQYNKKSVSNKFNFELKSGKYGWNILHYAVIYSDIQIIQTILKTEVNGTLDKDVQNRTPRDLALINTVLSKILRRGEIKFTKNKLHTIIKQFKYEPRNSKPVNFCFYKKQNRLNNFNNKKLEMNDDSELNEGSLETDFKIKDYTTKSIFLNANKFDISYHSRNSGSNIAIQQTLKNRNRSMPEVNSRIKLNIDLIHRNLNKNSPINSEKNIQFDIFEENPIMSINSFFDQDFANKNLSEEKAIIKNNFENQKIETIIKNNLSIKLFKDNNSNVFLNNHIDNLEFKEFKEFKELKNEILFKENPFKEQYRKLIKKTEPIFEKLRIIYRILSTSNKNSIEIFNIFSDYSFEDSIQSDIIYLSSIKGRNCHFIYKKYQKKLVNYELNNRLDLFHNEAYFSKIESNIKIQNNLTKLGDRSKSLGEGYAYKNCKLKNTIKALKETYY